MDFHANRAMEGRHGHRSRLQSLHIATVSVLRSLPLFLAARPRTPLRVLCIVAFDTLYMLRASQRLSKSTIRALAALLDFGACANAAFDNKGFCRKEFRATRQLLREAGWNSSAIEYLRRLRKLERSRPSPDGFPWQFHIVQAYREAVVRVSLETLVAAVMGSPRLEEGGRSTYRDERLELLFRMVMQCQIIDDVVDYSKDARAGLPGFLTASDSLLLAYELTRHATLEYADDRDLARSGENFPFRLALVCVSTCARLVLRHGRWRHRKHLTPRIPEPVDAPRLLAADVPQPLRGAVRRSSPALRQAAT